MKGVILKEKAAPRRERGEYHPRALWETPWEKSAAPSVEAAGRVVLYDAQERPLSRQIGFRRCQS